MECLLVDETPTAGADNGDQHNSESAEHFQTFIYELFEQNGILNDLRAYLRGHIVNVLKNAETGNPLPCQKNFTQRLELTYQALNILVAEYLMRLEFNYSLSVFISEIPLANMVFAFAKTLMQNKETNHENLKFIDQDVWCILNYLGIKCDSVNASNVIDMYKREENSPLLLCILKCIPMYTVEPVNVDPVHSSEESTISSAKSSDSRDGKHAEFQRSLHLDRCKHYVHCKNCQIKFIRVKEKYMRKKKKITENTDRYNLNPLNLESHTKTISMVERCLIDEMFQQLKEVYEAEVEMLQSEEEKRRRSSVADHAIRFKMRQEEMEEHFKAREQELERNVRQKKKFLWGLARNLREQHSHMMRAMRDLKMETKRLSAKEESLKTQLADAEQLLRQRGEEMRIQISNELIILEKHLESMRQERNNIDRERTELEKLKNITENNKQLKIHNIDSGEMTHHYELLKNEFTILKKYIEASKFQPKCVIERSTVTDLNDISSKLSVVLNNSHEVGFVKNDDDILKSRQVVNDLKKPKNVNFSQSNLDEIYRERTRDRSRSSASSDVVDANSANAEDLTVKNLKEENEKLKHFSGQQREHIDSLLCERARLQSELAATQFRLATESTPYWRPRTAPAVMPRRNDYVNSSETSAAASTGWRLGAGEELSVFLDAHPRVLVPGDEMPFIGALRDRHHEHRRRLINQWRMLRRRISPLNVSKTKLHSSAQRNEDPTDKNIVDKISLTNIQEDNTDVTNNNKPPEAAGETHTCPKRLDIETSSERFKTKVASDVGKNIDKSQKCNLKEDIKKSNKGTTKDLIKSLHSRGKSPDSVLREAKVRLRKLEIEAEAVEQSYLEFKKRQSLMKDKRINLLDTEESVVRDVVGEIDVNRSKLIQKLDEKNKFEIPYQNIFLHQSAKVDFEKYLKGYKTKLVLGDTHFKNKDTTAIKIKPIPKSDRNMDNAVDKKNYLETPLNEFRKFYNSTKRPIRIEDKTVENQENKNSEPVITIISENDENNAHLHKDALKKENKNNAELENFKPNISKIYNLNESSMNNSVEKPTSQLLSNQSHGESKTTKPNKMKVECSSKSEKTNVNPEPPKSISINSTKKHIISSPHRFESELNYQMETNISLNSKTNNDNIKSPKCIIDNTLDKTILQETRYDDSKLKKSINYSSNMNTKNDNLNSSVIDIPNVDVESVAEFNIINDIVNDIESVNISNKDEQSESDGEIQPQMTIIVSPKIPKDYSPRSYRNSSSEQTGILNRNDVLDAVSLKKDDQVSNVEMDMEASIVLEGSASDIDKEYGDDFSADVDNYNSRSEYESDVHSPLSILKTSDDENFWGS